MYRRATITIACGWTANPTPRMASNYLQANRNGSGAIIAKGSIIRVIIRTVFARATTVKSMIGRAVVPGPAMTTTPTTQLVATKITGNGAVNAKACGTREKAMATVQPPENILGRAVEITV
jgi:hypothetical protein